MIAPVNLEKIAEEKCTRVNDAEILVLLTAVLTFKECSSVATLLTSTTAAQFVQILIYFSIYVPSVN